MLKIIETALKYGYTVKFEPYLNMINVICERDGKRSLQVLPKDHMQEHHIVNTIVFNIEQLSKEEMITKKK